MVVFFFETEGVQYNTIENSHHFRHSSISFRCTPLAYRILDRKRQGTMASWFTSAALSDKINSLKDKVQTQVNNIDPDLIKKIDASVR